MTFVEDVLSGRASFDDVDAYRDRGEGTEGDCVLGHVIEARRRADQDLRTYLAARRRTSPAPAGLWGLSERYAEEWACCEGDLGGE